MKTMICYVLLAMSALILMATFGGCGHGNDDFSDLENIIKNDKEGIFGIELADDNEAQEVAANVVSQDYTLFGKQYNVQAGRSQGGVLFGRVRVSFRRFVDIQRVNDTSAVVTVKYRMTGDFVVIEPDGTSRVKPFQHEVDRAITFAMRDNPVTGEPWTPISFSAAYGSSPNSRMQLDSLRISTKWGTVEVDDPLSLNVTAGNIFRLVQTDTIRVEIKAHKTELVSDSLVGTIVTGRNRNRDGRFRVRMMETDGNRFGATLRIGLMQPDGINQLGVDFYTRSTIQHPLLGYDSFLIMVPYRVGL